MTTSRPTTCQTHALSLLLLTPQPKVSVSLREMKMQSDTSNRSNITVEVHQSSPSTLPARECYCLLLQMGVKKPNSPSTKNWQLQFCPSCHLPCMERMGLAWNGSTHLRWVVPFFNYILLNVKPSVLYKIWYIPRYTYPEQILKFSKKSAVPFFALDVVEDGEQACGWAVAESAARRKFSKSRRAGWPMMWCTSLAQPKHIDYIPKPVGNDQGILLHYCARYSSIQTWARIQIWSYYALTLWTVAILQCNTMGRNLWSIVVSLNLINWHYAPWRAHGILYILQTFNSDRRR